MRRWTAIAMLLAAACLTATAQRRGGGMSAGSGRSGFAARGSIGVSRGSAFFGSHRGPGFATARPFGFPNRFNRRFVYGYPGYYYGYPYSSYWSYYGDAWYPLDSYQGYNTSAPYVDPSGQQNAAQQDEIDRLENEVDRLREQPESASANSQRNAQSRNEGQPVTVLVFEDKHTQQVTNYAIVGQTLWIFSEQRATKVPLALLDIPATTKANDDRGIDFRLPE